MLDCAAPGFEMRFLHTLFATAATTAALAAQSPPLRVLPDQLTWTPANNCGQQSIVSGDLKSPGLYSVRMKFAGGCRIQPHAHPHERVVVVLSGTMYVGFGARFDEGALEPMPPGSVWTEPAGQGHYAWARDGEVILHVTGVGPYGVVAPRAAQ